MADQNRTLEIDVKLDNRDLKKKAKDAEKSLGRVGKTAKSLGPLIAGAFGTAAVISFTKKAVDSFIRQEKAIKQLEQRIKSTGGAAGVTAQEMIKLAGGLQEVTTFGDEAIIEMQSLLLTFTKIGGDVLPDTTEAVLNVATAMGTDLKSAAIQVGKALNDPAGQLSALSRSGIQFSDAQKTLIKDLVETNRVADAQKIILGELETQFGGAARAAKDTLGGSLESLNNAFGDALERLGAGGSGFIPLIQTLEKVVTSKPFLNGMDSVAKALDDVGWALGLIGDNASKAQPIFDWLENNVDTLTRALPGIQALSVLGDFRQLTEGGGGFDLPNQAIPERPATSSTGKTAAGIEETKELDEAELTQLLSQSSLIVDSWMSTEIQKTAILERETAARNALRDNEVTNAQAVAMIFQNLQALAGTQSKKAFEVAKAAGIAEAIVGTYTGATQAFKEVPYPLNFVASASIIAAGLANVQKIKSTKFGGGGSVGGGTSPSGATGGTPSNQFGTAPIAQPTTQAPGVNVPQISVISGDTLLGKMVEEQVIPAINDALRRGVSLDLEFA